jgi:hypothetical protein
MSLPHKDTHKPLVRRVRLARGTKGLARTPIVRTHDATPTRTKRKPLRAVGNNSKSRVWINARPKLKAKFSRAGITSCEARWAGCWRTRSLTFAHSLKRRHITDSALMNEVALLCIPCHDKTELKGEAKMSVEIRGLIATRADRETEAA